MVDIYVRSTDGNNVDDGSTWALAKATIPTAISAGTRVVVSQVHSESLAVAKTITVSGTSVAPGIIACGNDVSEPPTTPAITGKMATTGANAITFAGTYLVVDGVVIEAGSGAVNTYLNIATAGNQVHAYRNCDFILRATGPSASITTGTASNLNPSQVTWEKCNVKFLGTNGKIINISTNFDWSGGTALPGTATPSGTLFQYVSAGEGVNSHISGVDFSNFASTLIFFNVLGQSGYAEMRNCRLPANWSGSLVSAEMGYGCRVEMHNCDSADTNYRLWVQDYWGTVKSETALVRTGGASDGTTSYSWQVASNANASKNFPLWAPEVVRWNDTVAVAVTVTVEILHDSVTALQDDEVWLEVMYLGTAGYPLGSHISDRTASVFATPVDQTSSAEVWTTTGMTNPNKQKLTVTFTPQEKGYIHAKVYLGKDSKTIYVDPKITVS